MNNREHLEAALRELGYTVVTGNDGAVINAARGSEAIRFTLNNGNYSAAAAAGRRTVETISRKYAETGVRAFARARGYAVQYDEAEQKITLISRRV